MTRLTTLACLSLTLLWTPLNLEAQDTSGDAPLTLRAGPIVRSAPIAVQNPSAAIVSRNTFRLHFGEMRQARALLPEGREIFDSVDLVDYRFLVDVTGEFYTLVLEMTYRDLGHFEAVSARISDHPGWSDWYGRFSELVREGNREIFRVVE